MSSFRFALCAVLATVTWHAGTSRADAMPLVDSAFGDTSIFRTEQQNPFFQGTTQGQFVSQRDVAGVNFHYNDGGSPTVPSGTTFLGVGIDNIDISGAAPPSGPFALVENDPGPMLTLNLPFTSDNTNRGPNFGATGTDASVVNLIGNNTFYLSNGGDHPLAQLTFSGLNPNKAVYVQLIGGGQWNGDLEVDANGVNIGTWTTVTNGSTSEGSLFAFESTTDVSGSLTLDITVPSGNFAAVAGVLVSEQVVVPEPSSAWLAGLGLIGLCRSRARRTRPC